MAFTIPSFVLGAEVLPISVEGRGIIPISHELKHWAKTYVDQLSEKFDIDSVYDDKDFDNVITVGDFQQLVKLIIDQEYGSAPDAMTREAVVYELTRIWAQKTGRDLESIPVIKMLIYSDTDRIDAKYNQGITVAYMRDIAKGKGSGLFDPKADVTYGEFAALLYNTVKAVEDELNPIDESGVESKFETRGNYEIKDDKVGFDFKLVNLHAASKRLMFGSGQQFEITITDEEGQEVYRYSDGKFFTLALIYKNIKPGEAIKWQDEWDMTNKEGKKLTSGEYEVQIRILVEPEEAGERIEKDQLTTNIDFSLDEPNRAEVEKAAQQYLPEDASFSIGDLDGDGILEIASITRTDAETPSVKLQVYSYIDGSFELEYESQLEEGGYPDQVVIGAADREKQAIFVDIGVGAHSGITEILIKENGEYKSVLADSEIPPTFKPYPLFSTDINGDGIIEVGIQAAPPGTDHLPKIGIPWINCWYQWDGEGGLTEEPVMEEYSSCGEEYRFIIPDSWRGKYTIERQADESQAVSSVRFIYLNNSKERAVLLTLHHIPKAGWEQQKQQMIENKTPYVLLGQNSENMLVAELLQASGGLSGESLREYRNMLPDKESILESFIVTSSKVYENKQYGFKFILPGSWEGYDIIIDEWEGLSREEPESSSAVETGPVINIRHPGWTSEDPRQDIPIMVFTLTQWEAMQEGEFHIGAAPVGPKELGRNDKYVFALPARYNYAFPTGYQEVESILESSPLKPLWEAEPDMAENNTQVVQVYYTCSEEAPGGLYPVNRKVSKDADPVKAALEEMLCGPTKEEQLKGYRSYFSRLTAGMLRGVTRSTDGKTITIDFVDFSNLFGEDDIPRPTSFGPGGVMADITWTVFKQFPEVQALRFAFEGDEDVFWLWLSGKPTQPQAFTRTDWEQI